MLPGFGVIYTVSEYFTGVREILHRLSDYLAEFVDNLTPQSYISSKSQAYRGLKVSKINAKKHIKQKHKDFS
jgi:hypothetical protein